MWCSVSSINSLPFFDIIGCFLLQVFCHLLMFNLSFFFTSKLIDMSCIYRQFMDESLSTTAASCPHIESLILSSCLSIGPVGLSSLHWLHHLTLLDLSYTFLMNLQPVFDTCSRLVVSFLEIFFIWYLKFIGISFQFLKFTFSWLYCI